MKERAITGLGVVSALAIGREAFFGALGDAEAIAQTAPATTELLGESVPGARTQEIRGWDPDRWLGAKGHRSLDRLTKFLITAARLALIDAGIKRDGVFLRFSSERLGICSATAYGSLDAITELNRVAELEDPRYINPQRFPNTVINAAAGYVSIWEDLAAPNTTLVNGNCGALDAVLSAETHIAHRRGDAFLVGGGEVMSEPLYLAMRQLGLLDEDGGAGFGGREGFVLGEGAAYAVVERLDEARARGARILAELIGYGAHFEPPASAAQLAHASAASVERAILAALADAGLQAGDVDLVCSARSGLPMLDEAEREGIARALGAHVPLAYPKAIFGETLGGAGALGMASAIAFMHGSPIPAIASEREGVPSPRVALVVALGFYGNVSVVVLRATGSAT